MYKSFCVFSGEYFLLAILTVASPNIFDPSSSRKLDSNQNMDQASPSDIEAWDTAADTCQYRNAFHSCEPEGLITSVNKLAQLYFCLQFHSCFTRPWLHHMRAMLSLSVCLSLCININAMCQHLN